jgi:hypothetical protein
MPTLLSRPKISSLVKSQLPEFIREDYQTFIAFLEAYYQYIEENEVDLKTLRDLDNTLEEYIRYFKSELASNLPSTTVDSRFLLQHIKEQYNAKGSESSFKLLFRLLFNKDVSIEYPSKQVLRASDGRYNQDNSLFARILTGNPQDPVGKLVDVITPSKTIRVLVDRRQDVEIEVDRAIRVSDDIYEYLIDRRFFGNISVGDRLRYRDDDNGIYFTAEILPTTTGLEVLTSGTGFRVGDIYNIRNFDGTGSILKVSTVNSTGGISKAQFIKFGTGYSTDFTTTISATSGQDVAGTAGTVIQRLDTNVTRATLTGTLAVTNNSTSVTGTGTSFTAEVAPGDLIFLPNGVYTVATVPTLTSLTLTSVYLGTTASGITTVYRARAAGGGVDKHTTVSISEKLDGFAEVGTFSSADYSLGDLASTLTGTLAVTNGSSTVTGTSSLFTTQLQYGDIITLPNGTYTFGRAASNTSLTLVEAPSIVSQLVNVVNGSTTVTRVTTALWGTSWVATTAVTPNQKLYYGNNLYVVVTAGTTSTSPPYDTGLITNGSAVLRWVSSADIAWNTGEIAVNDVIRMPDGNTYTVASRTAGALVLNTAYTGTTAVHQIISVASPANYTGSTTSGLASVVVRRPGSIDGTYTGLVLREFGISSADSTITNTDPAIIKVTLGSLAKYPGYYVTNDSFLNDAIYIQDSRYYQAYSYVIKIDESLEAYKAVVKNLIHPAGMALFGEYDIRNEFDIGQELESLVKILAITETDSVTMAEIGLSLTSTRLNPSLTALSGTLTAGSTAGMLKTIDDTTLNFNGFIDTGGQLVVMIETGNAADLTRINPDFDVVKPINDTSLRNLLNDGVTVDTFFVTMIDGGDDQTTARTNPSLISPTSALLSGSDAGFMKLLNYNHFINDGVTADTEQVMMLDGGDDQTTARTNPALVATSGTLLSGSDAGFMKLLNTTTLTHAGAVDNNSFTMTDGGDNQTSTRTNPAFVASSGTLVASSDSGVYKVLDSVSQVRYLNDGITTDSDTQSLSDTDAANASDLNRTRPAFSVTFRTWDSTNGSLTHVLNNGVTLDNDTAPAVDSGGFLDLNPYAEAGFFVNDGGLYVGNQINFTG